MDLEKTNRERNPLLEAGEFRILARRHGTALLSFALAACAVTGARAEEAVHWYSTIEEASAHAIPDNRPMIIDFWAAWCHPCDAMEKEVYPTAEFRQAAQKFLPVKIDYDRKLALARKYDVEGLPTIVFLDSYGKDLEKAEQFAALAADSTQASGDIWSVPQRLKTLAEVKVRQGTRWFAWRASAARCRDLSRPAYLLRSGQFHFSGATGWRSAISSSACRFASIRTWE